ncbi:MAG: response regulator, partial [Acidobacteriota bacterium]|nr:response regulator [Acidobacteriota bacterium]
SEGEGRGARFTFAMPCAVGGAVEEVGREEAAPPREGLPVLLVEDSSETLELLQMLFSRKGYDVMGASSAAEALDRAGERRPSLIVSDISMPGVDGYELLGQLRQLPGLEGVPAIALTGHAMDEDRDRALAAGFSVHVPKPVDPEELFRIVQHLTT